MRSLLCIIVVALAVTLPASASASTGQVMPDSSLFGAGATTLVSSPVTHRALIAAERKFEQITPSHWRHGRVTCRRPNGARTWRCKAVVTGTHHYQGTFDMRVTRTRVRFVGYNVVLVAKS